jgi:hypothetical protein
MNETPIEPVEEQLVPEYLVSPDEASLLWDEYKYRHDLIWRHLIRSTIVLVALITVRYTTEFGGNTLLSFVGWSLAVAYTGYTILVTRREIQLFDPIKTLHRKRQRFFYALHSDLPDKQGRRTGNGFYRRLMLYLTILLILVILAGPISLCHDKVVLGFTC